VTAAPLLDESLARMVSEIYEASLAPERWTDVLTALAGLLGGNAAVLHAGASGAAPSVIGAAGLIEAALQSYRIRYGALDRAARAAAEGAAWSCPITARRLSGDAIESTEFFAGWMRPNDVDDCLWLSLLAPPASHRAVIGVYRSRCAGRFGAAEISLMAELAPHLRRAVEVHRRLAYAAAHPSGPLAEALDRLAPGVILTDAAGVLVWANRAAERLLQVPDGISLDRRGALGAASPASSAALRRLLAAAAAGRGGALPLPRPSGFPALAAHAVPLSRCPSEATALLPVVSWPSVLMLITDRMRKASSAEALQQWLRAIFGLTAAEATVAAQAAQGIGLPEVAHVLGLGVTTARTHAQRVFDKAGVRGQAELARLVERLSVLHAEMEVYMPGGQVAVEDAVKTRPHDLCSGSLQASQTALGRCRAGAVAYAVAATSPTTRTRTRSALPGK
jgi:DNA-binding CsgD family transcriptional regulator/PAS domain-containing protein